MKKQLKTLFLTLILAIGFTSTSFAVKDTVIRLTSTWQNMQGSAITTLTTNIGDTVVIGNWTSVTLTFVVNTTTTTSASGSYFMYKVTSVDVPNFNITASYMGVSSTLPVYVNQSTTGIVDITNKVQFNAFPSPVTDVLTIKGPTNLGTINVFSLTGQVVFSDVVKETSTRVDFSILPVGIYFVRVGDVIRKVIRK